VDPLDFNELKKDARPVSSVTPAFFARAGPISCSIREAASDPVMPLPNAQIRQLLCFSP
jgi:hypothetical protein